MSESIISGGDDLIERVAELGGEVNKPFVLRTPKGESENVVIVPKDYRTESLAKYCPPQRIEHGVRLQEVESFNAYVNRFKTDNSLIFCNVDDGAVFTAILDYHGPAPELKPDYCRHKAQYTAQETPEWSDLCGKDKVEMSQVHMAEFLEENSKMFRKPSGADMLELVRGLYATRNARFEQAVRLQTGAHCVSYNEDIVVKSANTTKAGSSELPGELKVGCAVYVGGEEFEITCRLKTRIRERQLFLFYEIVGFAEIVRESTLALVKDVHKATGILPFCGAA